MKKTILIFMLVLLAAMALVSADRAKPVSQHGKITEFSVSDIPNDGGSGLVLKWKPLGKSHRVISYNIYRGVSQDSLFLIGTVEVDPKAGVTAPELFYYDRGDQPLIEFESAPVKLKREKDQAPGSPLYTRFPQDYRLLGSIADRFNIVAAIKNSKLYNGARPIKTEDDVIAGIKINGLETVYAMPKVDQTYYYTVLAVNERGRRMPYADIQSAAPVDNPPDNKAILHCTYVPETTKFNFEWSPSVESSDIAMWAAFLYPKSGISNPDVLPENWQTNATLLFQIPAMSGAGTQYHSVNATEAGIALPAGLDQYTIIFAYADGAGQQNASLANSFRIISAAAMPTLPKFSVIDKKNDKGDNLIISIGKPVAYVSNASFTNQRASKLQINYELAENEHYVIDQILFRVEDKDRKLIGEKTEHYLDKAIIISLPKAYQHLKDMYVKTAVKVKGNRAFETDWAEQHIVYDEVNKIFRGEAIKYKGEALDELYYDVLTKTVFDGQFSPGNRTNGTARSYEYTSPYEDILYVPVQGFDPATRRLKTSYSIMVDADAEKGLYFIAPLFRDKLEADLKKQKEEIDGLKKSIATYSGSPAPDSLTTQLKDLEDAYNFVVNHKAYTAAKAQKSERAWLRTLLAHAQDKQRSTAFQLLKTDGEGAFVISDVYADSKGNIYMLPQPEWFDDTKLMTLVASFLLVIFLIYAIYITRRKEVYIRPIAGLNEIDNAIGRATEMGRPVMFVPGWGSIGEVCTIASMMILNQIAKKTAEFDIRLISPHCDYMVLPLAQEMIQNSYSEVGRPDAYNQSDVFFVSYDQFPFCAGVNGITVRERVATVFYMGFFNAEALLLTETGNQAGAVQVAGTDAVTQIPFFITTCDYTLIGEEFYAASAYLSRNHDLVSMLKAQDYFKLVIVIMMVIGTVLSTLNITGFINSFPIE